MQVRRAPPAFAFAAIVVLVVAGCGDGKPSGGGQGARPSGGGGAVPAGGGAPAAGGKAYDAAASKGSVAGTVKFAGEKPKPVALPITGDSVCEGHWAGKQAWAEKFTVNDDGTFPHCFVWAHKGPHTGMTGFKPAADFSLDQKDCYYVPHVFGVMEGQKFTVKNSDTTTHNVHVRPAKNREINQPQTAGASDTFAFSKKEKAIPFRCDIHSWMSAWCFVLDHPFFATTDAQGRYEIKGLPDGDYTFKVWHEGFAAAGEDMETDFQVSIKDGQAVTHDVELK